MTKDMRHYAKFTLDFPDNPKILPLPDAAFRCLIEATIWSRCHQTDGLVPRAIALAKWSPESLYQLCTNDLDNPSLFETSDHYIIHDYCEHQDTKAEIRARQEHAKRAGQRGGQASAQARGKARGKATAQAKSNQRKLALSEQAGRARARVNGAPRAAATVGDEAIRRCGLCDDRGYIGLRAGPFVTCPHDKKLIDEMEHEYEAAE